jgi:hypothetical protein
MKMPDERLLRRTRPRSHPRGDYSLHPLAALDGVLVYVALNGETVGYFFGATEEEAAEAVAADVLTRIAADAQGTSR